MKCVRVVPSPTAVGVGGGGPLGRPPVEAVEDVAVVAELGVAAAAAVPHAVVTTSIARGRSCRDGQEDDAEKEDVHPSQHQITPHFTQSPLTS